jgi:hypothetical protein
MDDASEYRKKALEALEAQNIQKYVDGGVSEELAKEIVETKKLRSELLEQKSAHEKEEVLRKNYADFSKEYPDVQPATIPVDVWKDFNEGIPLIKAYAAWDRKRLVDELAELKGKVSVKARNDESATSSPGSVSDSPSSGPVFFTEEQVAGMTKKQVADNLDAVMASMKKW